MGRRRTGKLIPSQVPRPPALPRGAKRVGAGGTEALLAALDELADADEKTPQLSGPDSMQH